MNPPTKACVKARITKAQSIKLDWNEACSLDVLTMISAYADAVGSPKHIFFPLFTVSASFMGINAKKIHQ